MTSMHSDLPNDVASCHVIILEIRSRVEEQDIIIEEQRQMIAALQAQVEELTREVDSLRRSLYGSRRERFVTSESDDADESNPDSANNDIQEAADENPDEEGEVDDETSSFRKKKRRRQSRRGRQRRSIPRNVHRERVEHPLDEASIPVELRDHPNAKRFFRKMREELEYQPGHFVLYEHYEEVIAMDEETGTTTMITAGPLPAFIDRCFVGPSFLAYLTASRFADHLPYYRMEEILARTGVWIHRSTQWRWLFAVAEKLQPLTDLMRRRAMQSAVLGVDETPVPMIDSDRDRTRKSYIWAAYGDATNPYTCYYFTPTRQRSGPKAICNRTPTSVMN